ncbi:MAG: flagellar biosynthesis protein FliQ [Myxococcales bacterium]|nr:flagellar biosynthesis protein FliQ [Myxococcales bacterium]
MNPSEVMRIGQEAMRMALLLSAPVLVASLVVGTLVSLVQAVTQLHEQTLSFLPKLLAVVAVLAVGGGWMLEQAVAYATRSFDRIPEASGRVER